MATNPGQRDGNPTMDAAALYREEIYTDRAVGTLRVLGFSKGSILLSFLIESIVLSLLGGLLGCLLVLPLNGLETGTMNWNSFTDTSFAFRVDPPLLLLAVGIAMLLGVVGGLVPAWRASRLPPVEALRRL